jgi:hypothetical protein
MQKCALPDAVLIGNLIVETPGDGLGSLTCEREGGLLYGHVQQAVPGMDVTVLQGIDAFHPRNKMNSIWRDPG